jgi:hypothetical protein
VILAVAASAAQVTQSPTVQIGDGKVTGDKIAFAVKLDAGGSAREGYNVSFD